MMANANLLPAAGRQACLSLGENHEARLQVAQRQRELASGQESLRGSVVSEALVDPAR
jgi:hypothetical protein